MIDGSEDGVSGAAYAWAYSSCNPSADNNKIVNNTLATVGGDTGIFVGAYPYDSSYTPSAVNNKVITNKISGYTVPIDTSGATASKVHANKHPIDPQGKAKGSALDI